MSLPHGKTPVWNQIKNTYPLLHLAPRFAPPCSAFCSTLLRVLIPFAPHFDPIAPHFDPIAPRFDPHHSTSAPQLSPFLLSLKLTDTRFFKARAQVEATSVIVPSHSVIAPSLLRHAPSRSDAPAFYSAPHSSPKLRRF